MYNLELWKKQKKELKLTLNDIANQSGIGISTIKDIFRGTTYAPRVDTVIAIEKVLEIKDIPADEYEQGARMTKQVRITADEEDVLDKYKEIEKLYGEKGKELILEFCDALLKISK